ncbi:hypothetical protein F4Y59_03845 [Candidatus Poribacteria bacterium]|nr:hypothetical protein [Candidatus Poribacteria bacterium]MYK20222.1 hypothetical protein [Candidatus Poribacteria bacterium]
MPTFVDEYTISVLGFIDAVLQTSGTYTVGEQRVATIATIETRPLTRVMFVYVYKTGYPSATGAFTVEWYNNAARTQRETANRPTSPTFTPATPLDAEGDPAMPAGTDDIADADIWKRATLQVTAPTVPSRLAADSMIFYDIYGRITMPQADFDRMTGDDGVS